MGFQDVVFLPSSRASFSTTFHENCGRGESLGTATCHMTVAEGKQRHAPCRILLLRLCLFLC